MKVLIAGNDIVGYRIAEALMSDHEVTHVGPESPMSSRFEQLDVRMIEGQVTSPDVMREAGVRDTNVFIATTDTDEQNIVACLAAQRMGARRTVCVLTRPGFLDVSGDDTALAEWLGIDQVVRPSEQLADEILRIVTVPGALDVEIFAGGRVRLLSYAVEKNAPIIRAPLRSLKLPRELVLVMLVRGEEMIVPKGDTRVEPGDKVVAMGRWRALRRLLFRFLRGQSEGRVKRLATIIGGGTVGVTVARGLEEARWQVKLIESQRPRCEEITTRLGSLVLHGDGADLDLLEQENIADSSVLVAVTNNDEKNLLVSLLAKHLGVARIITRAERLANERMFEKVGIDVVRSAHGAAIRSVVQTIDESQSEIRAELEHGDARVIELELPEAFTAATLAELQPPTLAMVGTVMRGRQVIIPKGQTRLQPGDHLLVFCARSDEERTREFFMSPKGSQQGTG